MECGNTGCSIRQITPPETALGIDIGEDFIDLAELGPGGLKFHRVPLAGIERAPIASLRQRLVESCPGIGHGWLALIDSPRVPLDRSLVHRPPILRPVIPRSRRLDAALRTLLRARRPPIALSLFPTPPLAYFAACVEAPGKAHLRAAFAELFGDCRPSPAGLPSGRRGGIFTRFMLAGFLTFCAVHETGATAMEAYPDLQFRLWSRGPLPPKRARKAALAARVRILVRLRGYLGLPALPKPSTLDQADAEVLASTCIAAARRGRLLCLQHADEGSFALAAPGAPATFMNSFFPLARAESTNRPAASDRCPRR